MHYGNTCARNPRRIQFPKCSGKHNILLQLMGSYVLSYSVPNAFVKTSRECVFENNMLIYLGIDVLLKNIIIYIYYYTTNPFAFF